MVSRETAAGGRTRRGKSRWLRSGQLPLDCTPEQVQGRRLFISTTNGTRALQRVQAAPTVLAAAFVNRAAVVQYVLKNSQRVCGLLVLVGRAVFR